MENKTHDIFEDVEGEGVFLSGICGACVGMLLAPGLLDISGVGAMVGSAAGGFFAGATVYTIAPLVVGLGKAAAAGISSLVELITQKRTRSRNRSLWLDDKKPARKLTLKQQMKKNEQHKLREYLRSVARNDQANSHYGFYMGPSKETMDKAKARWDERRAQRKMALKQRKRAKKFNSEKYGEQVDKIMKRFDKNTRSH